MAAWQSYWSGKNADFSTLIGCHGNVPWKIKKAQWAEQALTPVYHSWNFGEDWSISFWATSAPNLTIKKQKIKKKHRQNIYPVQQVAERAKWKTLDSFGMYRKKDNDGNILTAITDVEKKQSVRESLCKCFNREKTL